MREIIHLPLGRRTDPIEMRIADARLDNLHEEYDSVEIVGIYTDAMSYTAQPIMVLVVTSEESD